MKLSLFALVAAALAPAAEASAALISPDSGHARASVAVFLNGGAPRTGAPGVAGWDVVPPTTPQIATSVFAQGPVSLSASTTATWTNIEGGLILFDSSATVRDTDGLSVDAAYAAGPAWDYAFDVVSDSVFALNYDVISRGTVGGQGRWRLSLLDDLGATQDFVFSPGIADPVGEVTGDLSVDLAKGRRYTISLSNDDQLTRPHASISDQSVFRWSVDPAAGGAPGVPEPASWALMILGFGASGAALRRRRAALAQ
jgi:hypothetical protein